MLYYMIYDGYLLYLQYISCPGMDGSGELTCIPNGGVTSVQPTEFLVGGLRWLASFPTVNAEILNHELRIQLDIEMGQARVSLVWTCQVLMLNKGCKTFVRKLHVILDASLCSLRPIQCVLWQDGETRWAHCSWNPCTVTPVLRNWNVNT